MSQAKLKVVVEGPFDVQIVRAILGAELAKHLRFFGAQSRTALATVGRNILFHEGGPLLVVMDSDTLNPELAAESQSLIMAALRGAVAAGMNGGIQSMNLADFKVFTFVPEVEVVFFEAPDALERLLRKKVPQDKLREGTLLPKQVLEELLRSAKPPRNLDTLLSSIDPHTADAIASGKQAKALVETVESLLVAAAKA